MSDAKGGALIEDLPTGTVTFLLTDVEGSTVMWDEHPEAMRKAMSRHHRIVHDAIAAHAGARPLDQGEGDSVVGAFARATDALASALDIQRGLGAEQWPNGAAILVRAAIHTGEVELRDDRNYFGIALNRCARLRAIAHGGQTLVSQATRDLVADRLPSGAHFKSLGPHRLKDLAVPENVYQLVHEDSRDDFPPLRSLDALPNNLPVQLTLFIGRDKEVIEVGKLVYANRLVTLTGAGGCGKTRLALQAVAEILENYPDGVWFVDLAPVADPELVPMGVANGLGLRTESSSAVEAKMAESSAARPQNVIQRLKDYIRDRRMLILVDNCEHLISASADVIDSLLRACPNLNVLATTREPLGVSGEATYRVPSLSVPTSKQSPGPEELAEYEAVRLFVHRASLVQDQFALSHDNSPSVAQICRRLDGIPLAIELAAARVKSLAPEQIAARLDDQFRLLTGGSRTALERQQTLRAAVDWSYQLLSEQERTLLMRLSVFVGGFTLEAAEEVCSDDTLATYEVLDLVGQLVDKSLVVLEPKGHAARYRQLETIRQFAREKLLESGEGSGVRTRHRDFFMNLAEQAEPELEGPRVGEWLDTLDTEIDNLRAALEWSVSDNDPEHGIRIAGALFRYWQVRGYGTEARSWLELLLAKDGEVSPGPKSRALRAAGFFVRGNRDLSLQYVEEAAQLARQHGDDSGLGRAMLPLGLITAFGGDVDKGVSLVEEAVSLARSSRDVFGEGEATYWLGSFSIVRGDHREARRLFESALTMARSIGTPLGIARILFALASEADHDRDYLAEQELLEEALAIARETGDTAATWFVLAELSRLAEIRNEDLQARELWEEATRIVRESGDVFWLHLLGNAAAARGDYSEALAHYRDCLVRYRELGAAEGVALTLNSAGWMAYFLGELSTAHSLADESVSMLQGDGSSTLLLAAASHSLGEIKRALGDLEGARPYLEEALPLARDLKIKAFETDCLFSLGAIARAEGDATKASSLLGEALVIAREVNETDMIASVFEGVAGLTVDRGKAEAAAKLFSAADALRESRNSRLPTVIRASIDQDLESVRAQIAPETFEKSWAEGRAMSIEDALRLAESV